MSSEATETPVKRRRRTRRSSRSGYARASAVQVVAIYIGVAIAAVALFFAVFAYMEATNGDTTLVPYLQHQVIDLNRRVRLLEGQGGTKDAGVIPPLPTR